MNMIFDHLSTWAMRVTGSVYAFTMANTVILAWIMTGHHFGYSNSWQLVINTSTTIVTFMMVFLIQAAQNRDSKALHLKLNEILLAIDRSDDTSLHIDATILDVETHAIRIIDMRTEEYKKLAKVVQIKQRPPQIKQQQ